MDDAAQAIAAAKTAVEAAVEAAGETNPTVELNDQGIPILPKRRRGRPSKAESEARKAAEAAIAQASALVEGPREKSTAADSPEPAPKAPRTRARKSTAKAKAEGSEEGQKAPSEEKSPSDGKPAATKVASDDRDTAEGGSSDGAATGAEGPKKPATRSRSRKAAKKETAEAPAEGETAPAEDASGSTETTDDAASKDEKPKARTRTRKSKAKAADSAEETAPAGDGEGSDDSKGQDKSSKASKKSSKAESDGEDSSAAPGDAAAKETKSSKGDKGFKDGKDSRDEKGPKDSKDEKGRKDRQNADQDRNGRNNNQKDRQDRNGRNNNQKDRQDRNGRNGQKDRQNRDNERGGRNRHKKNSVPQAPSLTKEELEGMKLAELREKAQELSIDATGFHRAELVDAIYVAAAAAEGFKMVKGILEIGSENYGFLRTGNFMQGDDDAFVQMSMIRSCGLRRGDMVEGTVRPKRPNDKFPALAKIISINGKDPSEAHNRPQFRDLTPIYPDERLFMETDRESITGRAIDLVSPIGKGQRGLIVSPPKAGKTTVLKRICQSIAHNNPEVHLICLLVDERPEEVTDMERSIHGDVVASTFDMPADNHTQVAELVIERAKRLVEMGEDVVVVLDSITRLARAYNLAAPASGRILSGGVDSAALYPPKRFLGAARNIEGGGSLTILASALVDTGSKMDEVIFEEFKGTGNMELKLNRELADKRIFPAIDPVASGTRNEELLIDPTLAPFVWGLRRILANMNNVERAEASLVKGLKQTNDNQEFLIRSAKKAAQTDYVD